MKRKGLLLGVGITIACAIAGTLFVGAWHQQESSRSVRISCINLLYRARQLYSDEVNSSDSEIQAAIQTKRFDEWVSAVIRRGNSRSSAQQLEYQVQWLRGRGMNIRFAVDTEMESGTLFEIVDGRNAVKMRIELGGHVTR